MPAGNSSTLALGAAVVLVLAGCASTPEALRGEFAGPSPARASDEEIGARVRWGGNLLEVRPEADRTCFEILSRPLADNGRPDIDGAAGRRFLACREGFTDPAALPLERPVTVTGTLAGFSNRRIGEYDYRFPVLEVDGLHLWPEPVERGAYPPPPWWYDPFYPYPYGRHPYYW
jgi:outer membrane lipoprotein